MLNFKTGDYLMDDFGAIVRVRKIYPSYLPGDTTPTGPLHFDIDYPTGARGYGWPLGYAKGCTVVNEDSDITLRENAWWAWKELGGGNGAAHLLPRSPIDAVLAQYTHDRNLPDEPEEED